MVVGHGNGWLYKVAEYGTDWTYVHDAKNMHRCLKNKLLVYAGV